MFLSLIGHDATTWTAWGTWAYTFFTLVLAFGAVAAWRNSRKQVAEMEESRKDAQRPLVIPVEVCGRPDLDDEDCKSLLTSVVLRNVGVGPALEVSARAWFAEEREAWLPEGQPSGSYLRGPFRSRAADAATSPITLAAGATADSDLLENRFPMSLDRLDFIKQVAFCVVDFRDIYGRRFRYPLPAPATPIDEIAVAEYISVVEVMTG